MFFYWIPGLVNNKNISNMAAISLLQVKNDAEAGCHSKNRPNRNVPTNKKHIANLHITIMGNSI